jgi:hypothetical protein
VFYWICNFSASPNYSKINEKYILPMKKHLKKQFFCEKWLFQYSESQTILTLFRERLNEISTNTRWGICIYLFNYAAPQNRRRLRWRIKLIRLRWLGKWIDNGLGILGNVFGVFEKADLGSLDFCSRLPFQVQNHN